VGNFTKYEEKDTNTFVIEGNGLETTYGNTLKINVEKKTGNDKDYNIDVKLPVGANLLYNNGFVNGISEIGVEISRDFMEGSTADIDIIDKNGNIIWRRTLPINVVSSAETEFEIQYIRSGRWKGALKITNTSDKTISGTLNITSPKKLAEKTPFITSGGSSPAIHTRFIQIMVPTTLGCKLVDKLNSFFVCHS
jgi:hypothetical protein